MDENKNMTNEEVIEETEEVMTEGSDERGMSMLGVGLTVVGSLIACKLIGEFVKPKVSEFIAKRKQKKEASEEESEPLSYDVDVVESDVE